MRAGWLALAACSAAPQPTPVSNARSAGPPSDVAITLEHTPCLGTCPTYVVTLHSDGRVDWTGASHVAVVGVRHTRIAPERVAELLELAERARFFERDEDGRLPCRPVCHVGRCDFEDIVICTDISRAVIAIRRDGKSHRVVNEHCQASPLDELEREIDEAAGTARWVGPD